MGSLDLSIDERCDPWWQSSGGIVGGGFGTMSDGFATNLAIGGSHVEVVVGC